MHLAALCWDLAAERGVSCDHARSSVAEPRRHKSKLDSAHQTGTFRPLRASGWCGKQCYNISASIRESPSPGRTCVGSR